MDPQQTFCLNLNCSARGQVGQGNIIWHSHKQQRYRCKVCGCTFSARSGTAFFRCRVATYLITLVLTLLAQGCPMTAIEAAFGFQARTVRHWMQVAGTHCEQVHRELVVQPRPLGQVQADELRVQKAKGNSGVLWMAMSLAVPTRLGLGGMLSTARDKKLIGQLAALIRACAVQAPLLLAVDGLSSYVVVLHKAFRSPWHSGERQRPRLLPWPQVVIGRVIKQYGKGRAGRRCVLGVRRCLAQGTEPLLRQLLCATQDKGQGQGVLNMAFIERLNATFRARLAPLVRRTRGLARRQTTLHAGMYLVGTVYNFCTFHDSLCLALGPQRTPAMAAGIRDHRWSVAELLWHRVPPPRWTPPKRRGQRSKALQELIQRWAT
jgi:transposase-like protein